VPVPRSLLWRLVPWLFPPLLIVVGLIFVATSLSGNDDPDDIVAPPNVRDIVTASAAPWAQRQVEPGTTSTVTAVTLALAASTSSTTYSVRAVITRIDTPAGTGPGLTPAAGEIVPTDPATGSAVVDVRIRSIVTCVRWTVDIRTGTIAEHGATQLSNDPGRREPGDPGALRSGCRSATFAN
jgi:hypothetical protein